MIGPMLLSAFVALPALAERRYRMEIAGEPVGFATLSVACAEGSCQVRWESALRGPAEAGGGRLERRIDAEVAPGGEARSVRAWQRDARGERERKDGAGPVPASLAETVLGDLVGAAADPAERRCITVRDESSGATGPACARRGGAWLELEVLGVGERARGAPGELPDEVVIPGQRVHFLRDPAAALPCRAPRLFGVAVRSGPGVRDSAPSRFCGLPAEGPPPGDSAAALPDGLELELAGSGSCREQTARLLARLRARGLEGRHVVGVAWDGSAWLWHEWAEVRSGTAWIPVDPAFRQAPAQGRRFAVARFAPGDPQAEAEAGQRVLACWSSGRLE